MEKGIRQGKRMARKIMEQRKDTESKTDDTDISVCLQNSYAFTTKKDLLS